MHKEMENEKEKEKEKESTRIFYHFLKCKIYIAFIDWQGKKKEKA